MFASVPSGRQVLTVNGLEYDYVHYRHNLDGVASVINNNHRFTPFADRLQEDGKVFVTIRVWDFDIDMIEVLDETTGEWHPMWSTDPDYTGGLSRWEHHHYMDFLASQDRGRKRQRGRVNAKAKQEILRSFDDEIYKLGIRPRGKRFALIEAEEERCRKLQNMESDSKDHAQGGVKSWKMKPGGEARKDVPRPPSQKGNKGGPRKAEHEAPKRPEEYGSASTAHLTRPTQNGDVRKEQSKYKFKPRRTDDGQ